MATNLATGAQSLTRVEFFSTVPWTGFGTNAAHKPTGIYQALFPQRESAGA